MILKAENVPAFITVAIFTSILIVDLLKAEYKYMLGHFLFGVIAFLLMLYLADSGATYVAYGVLLLPFVLLLLGWSIDSVKKASGETGAPSAPPATPRVPCGCSRCRSCPCICIPQSTTDASGSTVKPGDSSAGGKKGDSLTGTSVDKPSIKTELCGAGSASGKTQCVDVSTLTQV